ncbi:hypothetical protein HU200_042270 [Digitaria exilis]|uniref:KIB1-4 beta-propeller domain-containing protein n=1 Tax=Digitaria exilis TaxID=1010633 RepID=A0A835BB11_9POAL|nr:hypothetical protein HU200_042270 [Digitaria exilis]CAB3453291.1 unnamed protein product [Digitaria exilis]
MDVPETPDSPPPLDPSLAPVLLFRSGHGGGDEKSVKEETAGGGATTTMFLYSIPKRQLLPRVVGGGALDYLTSDVVVSWITPQGWVLTLNPTTRDASLRDPFSSGAVRLPQDRDSLLPAAPDDTRCLLSTTPHQPTCVVLVIHLKDPLLWHCSPGGDRWFRHEYTPELISGDRTIAIWAVGMLTAAKGKFYTSVFNHGDGHKLVALELSSSSSPGPVISATRVVVKPWLAGCFLVGIVESCSDLFAVRFNLEPLRGKALIDIYVYKLVPDENTWVKVAQLGDDRVFFFSSVQEFGASMAAKELGLKANCIYFTDQHDKGLYVYDMEQGSITLHNPGPDVPDSSEPVLLMNVT